MDRAVIIELEAIKRLLILQLVTSGIPAADIALVLNISTREVKKLAGKK